MRTLMRIAPVCLLMLSCMATLFPQNPSGSADTAARGEGFDIVIANAQIIDGTGSPWYSGQVGIRAGRIAAIGNLSAAPRRQTIDARRKVVAPGFIDMLGQSELTMFVDPRLPSKIFQGITTEITGEGNSVAPANQAMFAADRAGYKHLKIQPDWTTLRDYFARLERQDMGINLASYVGATKSRKEPRPARRAGRLRAQTGELLNASVRQSYSDDSYTQTQVDIQGAVSLSGIWVEGLSSGISALEGGSGRDQESCQGRPYHGSRRSGCPDGEDLACAGIRGLVFWRTRGRCRLDSDRVAAHGHWGPCGPQNAGSMARTTVRGDSGGWGGLPLAPAGKLGRTVRLG